MCPEDSTFQLELRGSAWRQKRPGVGAVKGRRCSVQWALSCRIGDTPLPRNPAHVSYRPDSDQRQQRQRVQADGVWDTQVAVLAAPACPRKAASIRRTHRMRTREGHPAGRVELLESTGEIARHTPMTPKASDPREWEG